MQIDLTCPVESRGVTVKTSSQTGEPYALFKLFNLSDQVIQTVSMVVHVYDSYGGEMGQLPVKITELDAQPKEFFAGNKAISLAEYPEAKHFVVEFNEVEFAEGEPYIKGSNIVEIKITEPDYDEQMRLITAAGEDACCYAKDEAGYWLCVCGRPNLHVMDSCIRCGREKSAVLAEFSSRDALTRTLEEQERIRQEEEAARLAEEARIKAEKIKKAKKTALISACIVVALILLFFIGKLIFNGVSVLLGNSAAKNNDAYKAYGYYAMAGNEEKLASVSEAVCGNTAANTMQLGVMTADAENLYYIDSMYNIYKENKETGERTGIGEGAGVYLNVSQGWLYYIDASTGQAIRRTSVDGATTETVFETTDSGLVCMALVGNELYFTLQETRSDMTPELQEQIAQTGNVNAMYQFRLYRQKIGAKKPTLVSDFDITQFCCYKGKIYYIDQMDSSLYVLERDGKTTKKLVSGPIYSFGFNGDSLYYIDGTTNEENGQPKLSIEKASLTDGAHQGTVMNDSMALRFGFEGDDMYYLAFHETNSTLRKKTAEEDIPVVEGCQLFNMIDGYTLYVDITGQFMKTTTDKSGYEVIVPVTEVTLPEEEAVLPTE